jgi:hypothetical protein
MVAIIIRKEYASGDISHCLLIFISFLVKYDSSSFQMRENTLLLFTAYEEFDDVYLKGNFTLEKIF